MVGSIPPEITKETTMFKGAYKVFPTEFIRQCVETYTKDHGKVPKILCANPDDIQDWIITATISAVKQFNLTVVPGTYLKPGEIDLAMGVKPS
jgi:hypothetical protein